VEQAFRQRRPLGWEQTEVLIGPLLSRVGGIEKKFIAGVVMTEQLGKLVKQIVLATLFTGRQNYA
jgi:hypothetical protein